MSMAEYLAIPALSSGLCNTLLAYSAYHAKHEQDNRAADDSDASDAGTAIHSALLEGMDAIVALDYPDWRTKAAKEARDAARAAGSIPMLAHKVERIGAAVGAAKNFIARSELAGVFDSGQPEMTLIWNEGAVLCKAKPDWLSADRSLMIHVKTTQGSANPDSWIRNQLTPCGYDLALAFYERGLSEVAQVENIRSVFLVIEQQEPHGCSLVGLDPASHDLASRKAARAIRLWAECQRSGKYPSYPSRICWAAPKPWEMAQEDEREMSQPFSERELEGGVPL
jgi:hypothetical protein